MADTLQSILPVHSTTQPLQASALEAHWPAIVAALEEVGEYGEVRLIIRKGRLRFLEVIRSQGLTDLPDQSG